MSATLRPEFPLNRSVQGVDLVTYWPQSAKPSETPGRAALCGPIQNSLAVCIVMLGVLTLAAPIEVAPRELPAQYFRLLEAGTVQVAEQMDARPAANLETLETRPGWKHFPQSVLAAAVLYVAEPTRVSILLGLPVAMVGALFRAMAAGVIKKDSLIATSGIYSLTRNPLYFGSSLLACGFAIMSWNEMAAVLLLFPFVVVYPTVILREEAHLEQLFPDEFRAYRSKVPRFFPRLTAAGSRDFSVHQYLSNREYNTALGFIGALAVLAMKSWIL